MNIASSREVPLFRVGLVYFFGLATGVQLALYLYDRYDDGVAEPLSLGIGLVMVLLSVIYILNLFRVPPGEEA